MTNMTTANDLFNQADKHYLAQRFAEAENAYKEALSINPNNTAGLFNFGMLCLRRGDLSGENSVINALNHNVNQSIDQARSVEAIAQTLLSIGYKKHALRWLNLARDNRLNLASLSALAQNLDLPDYLEPFITLPDQETVLERYTPFESRHYVYAIETVGGCNLRCPTCPVGNTALPSNGLMSIELFDQILKKIKTECIDSEPEIWLFNWSEPLLHPQIDIFIRNVRTAGLKSFISTNLNISHPIESVMLAQPDRLKVSVSSLKQEIYGKTHVRGKISTVIKNLERLAKYRDQQKVKTEIWVGHHLYKNTIEEGAGIEALAKKLGFGYQASYAIMAPLEKIIEIKLDANKANSNPIIDDLIFDPIDLARQNSQRRSGKFDCEMRFNMTTINFDGNINLCCGTTQSLRPHLQTAFLKTPQKRIDELKYLNSFCSTCKKHGLELTIQDV